MVSVARDVDQETVDNGSYRKLFRTVHAWLTDKWMNKWTCQQMSEGMTEQSHRKTLKDEYKAGYVTWTSGLAASSNKAQLIRCAVVSYPAVKKKPMFIARVSCDTGRLSL
jgi:hypothetical protein